MYLGGDEALTSGDWIASHLRTGHGPLGALYPDKAWTAPNPNGAMKEGDSPSWLYFLPIGPGDPSHPDWGGWGGRFTQEKATGLWRDAKDSVGATTESRATVWRWRPAFQDDFASRMDWCVKPFDQANHPPVAGFRGDTARGAVHLHAHGGERLDLNADGSFDPDHQRLAFDWSVYREAGTCPAEAKIFGADAARATLQVPPDLQAGQTIHILLRVTDDGAPPLAAYRRIIVSVE